MMKYLNLTFVLTVILITTVACNKNNNGFDSCIFIQNDATMDGRIDNRERGLMNDCREDELTEKDDLERTLVGEWELIGHGEGWVTSVSQPCALITITSEDLTFEIKSSYRDTMTVHTWAIEERNGRNQLTITPYAHELAISTICSDYMYGDATPVDGNMYLYQKVD